MTAALKIQPSIELKRKRIRNNQPEGSDSETDKHVIKKPITDQSITYTRNGSSYLPTYSQPLTPDDSSDDELMSCDQDVWYHRRALENDPHRLSSCSMSSVRVNIDDFDHDMDLTPSPRMIPRHERRPDMITTTNPRIATQLNATSGHSDERVPTPTASKFKSTEASIRPSYGRHHRMPQHTNLSPVMCEETGLPSPIASPDSNTEMAMDSTSNGLSGLSVYCHDDSMDMDHEQLETDTSIPGVTSPRKNGKTARLHMGFRTDCEKCVQKVPGHYSHIMWE